jgi:hypothetical protein
LLFARRLVVWAGSEGKFLAISVTMGAIASLASAQVQTLAYPTPHTCGDPVDILDGQISYYNGDGKTITCNTVATTNPTTGLTTYSEASGQDGMQYECVEFVRRYYRLAQGCDATRPCNTAKWSMSNAVSYFPNAPVFGLTPHTNEFDLVSPEVGDIVTYKGASDGHVAIIKQVTAAVQPDTWLVYVIEENVAPAATALPLLLTKSAVSGAYTLTDSFPNGIGVEYGYPVGAKSRLGVQYSIQGWLRLPAPEPVQWLTFTAGDPGMPGDGILINTASAGYVAVARPISLTGFASGLTVSVFSPDLNISSVLGFESVSFLFENIGAAPACLSQFGFGGPPTVGEAIFDSTDGVFTNLSAADLGNVVTSANVLKPGCAIKLSDLSIVAFFLQATKGPNETYINRLDGLALGQGINNFPGVRIR